MVEVARNVVLAILHVSVLPLVLNCEIRNPIEIISFVITATDQRPVIVDAVRTDHPWVVREPTCWNLDLP